MLIRKHHPRTPTVSVFLDVNNPVRVNHVRAPESTDEMLMHRMWFYCNIKLRYEF